MVLSSKVYISSHTSAEKTRDKTKQKRCVWINRRKDELPVQMQMLNAIRQIARGGERQEYGDVYSLSCLGFSHEYSELPK